MSNRAPETHKAARKFLARLLLLAVPVIYTLVLAGGEPTQPSTPDISRVAYATVTEQPRKVVAVVASACLSGKVQAEDGTCVPPSFYDEPVTREQASKPARKSCPAGKVMAEDRSCVPPSFYDKPVKRKAEKAETRKSDKPRESVAEDGSKVKPGFYDRTDYNADGAADQEQGWSKNPNPDDVKAGRK